MSINRFYYVLFFALGISLFTCCTTSKEKLGRLQNGATVSFVLNGDKWGININQGDSLIMSQSTPIRLDIYAGKEKDNEIAWGYESVKKVKSTVTAVANVIDNGIEYVVNDTWSISDGDLQLEREITVKGSAEEAGFNSSICLYTPNGVEWEDCNIIIPGIIYGKPHTNPTSAGGSKYYDAGFFSVREDYMSAPMIVLATPDGKWSAMMDPSPNGATTIEETLASAWDVIIDERLGFGAMKLNRLDNGGIAMSFVYPGTTDEFGGMMMFGGNDVQSAKLQQRRRYHPVRDGFTQSYKVDFRFDSADKFTDVERNSWRWAWNKLNPQTETVDVDVVKQVLLDHLADRVITYQGRAGVPFVIDAQSGKPGSFRPTLGRRFRTGTDHPDLEPIVRWAEELGITIDPDAAELNIWPWAVIGFCGKHVEIADQFLMESHRDTTARGRRFGELGNAIMETLVKNVPMSPPIGEGIDLRTGKVGNIHGGNSFGIRPISEDMSTLMDLIEHERAQGIEHPDWFAWGKSYADWLLPMQLIDGSFSADWGDDGEISDPSGAKSYSPISMYAKLYEQTGERKYIDAAIKAGDYLWNNYGSRSVYLGATGSSVVADKESGMLSLDAFLTLYQTTEDSKWLDRAVSAGDYTESWIWIWNVPMPIGADTSQLGWKPEVPTIGVNGIGSNDIGGVDQYLDWAVPLYAKLYKFTSDEHYKDVARILLHGTKSMLALPGRSYDLAGPGWQQEHWRMGPVRGIGAHRTWLPWISINHLHGITAMKEFDEELFDQLTDTDN